MRSFFHDFYALSVHVGILLLIWTSKAGLQMSFQRYVPRSLKVSYRDFGGSVSFLEIFKEFLSLCWILGPFWSTEVLNQEKKVPWFLCTFPKIAKNCQKVGQLVLGFISVSLGHQPRLPKSQVTLGKDCHFSGYVLCSQLVQGLPIFSLEEKGSQHWDSWTQKSEPLLYRPYIP